MCAELSQALDLQEQTAATLATTTATLQSAEADVAFLKSTVGDLEGVTRHHYLLIFFLYIDFTKNILHIISKK